MTAAGQSGERIFQGRHPALAVADNGRDSEKAISQIKEPFYRVDKARSRKEGGAGLGLSICEQIAQVHQAQLQIGSAPGKGTVIWIIFPEI
ncbi:MAG: ATP-binding protein [Eisenbergiella massiliensis]